MYRVDEKAAEIAEDLRSIELDVVTGYTLGQAILEGSKYTDQAQGWGDGCGTACALTSAFTAAKARGFLE